MTTATTTTLAVAPTRPRRSPRAVPDGVPRWLWLFGVTVHRLEATRAGGPAAWVVSAGGGASGLAAVLFDTPEQERAPVAREDRT